MKLSELFRDISYNAVGIGDDAEIANIVSDSRKVKKGDLFIAIRGTKSDGHLYAEDAYRRGAVAVVCEYCVGELPSVIVEDTRLADSFAWYRLCKINEIKAKLIAVTGTNGKTSTAHYIASILRADNKKCAVMGTLGAVFEKERLPFDTAELSDAAVNMTTPDPELLYNSIRRLSDMGSEYIVMEVSSHALALKKVAPLHFEMGVFTNLSSEHLDFHKSMDEYFKCKATLFESCDKAVISIDDSYGVRLYNSLESSRANKAVASARDIIKESYDSSGVSYSTVLGGRLTDIHSSSYGVFAVLNSYLAAKAAELMGIESSVISLGIEAADVICGRMEKLSLISSLYFEVYIDYAHTPDAMKRAIISLRSFRTYSKLTVVFGCGGDRDRSKRAVMGAIAEKYADRVIVTSDNPRTENREEIIKDILSGFKEADLAVVIADRKKATEYALKTAKAGEVLLFLGKGHEDYEICGNSKIPYNEKEVIMSAVRKLY